MARDALQKKQIVNDTLISNMSVTNFWWTTVDYDGKEFVQILRNCDGMNNDFWQKSPSQLKNKQIVANIFDRWQVCHNLWQTTLDCDEKNLHKSQDQIVMKWTVFFWQKVRHNWKTDFIVMDLVRNYDRFHMYIIVIKSPSQSIRTFI